MKWSFLLFSSFLCLQAIAQYPATGNKMRLGWQTTGDGLVYRGAIGDTATLDPSGINNAWMLLDTANGNLYAYRAKAWRLVSGGGGGGGLTMPFDSVTFNVNETDASLRELKYSEEKGYLQYGGQDSVQIPILPGIWYVRNDTSVTIPKGTVLRATGTLGASGRIKVKHMIANGSIDAMYILGIAMQDIAVGADGYAMSQGKIRKINTQAYSEGAVLYADVDTLGGLTQTEPTGSNLKLPIAFVVNSASNGTIAVRVTSGAYMRDLHDTYITSPDSSASLYYNKSEGIWRDTTPAVLKSDISGTANYLAKFTGSNAVGNSVAFETGRNLYINSAQGNTSNALNNSFEFNGYGSAALDQPFLAVIGNVGVADYRPRLAMYRTKGTTVNDRTLVPFNHHLGSIMWNAADGVDMFSTGAEITAITDSITGENDMPTALTFATTANGAASTTERMRITSAGNVGIATSSPSYPLHVNGTSYANTVITNGNFVGNGQLTTADARSGLVSIGPASGTIPAYNMGGYATFHGAMHTTKPGNVEFGVGQNTTGKIIFYTDNFGQNQTMTLTNNSFVGINTASPSRPLHVAGTTAIRIPAGNLAERGTSDNGDIRVRTDTASMEYYSGAWRTVAPMARVPQSGLANRFSKFDANGLLDTSAVLVQANGRIGIWNSPAAGDSALTVTGGIRATTGVRATLLNVNTSGTQVLSINNYSGNPNASPNNVFIGNGGQSTTGSGSEGRNNIGIGTGALFSLTTGYFNLAIGTEALSTRATNILSNVAIGYQAMQRQGNTQNNDNTAIGTNALRFNKGGNYNVALGSNALAQNTTSVNNDTAGVNGGSNNFGLGFQACYWNGTGLQNVGIGSSANYFNRNGSYNIAIGGSALAGGSTDRDTVAKNNNVVIGTQALQFLKGNGTGNSDENVAIGHYAGRLSGSGAGVSFTAGKTSVYIGAYTRAKDTLNQNETVIGYSAIGNGSNTTTIGNSSTTNTIIPAGSLTVDVMRRKAPVTVTGNHTVADGTSWLICNGTAAIALTLPTASSWTGREIMVKTIQPYAVNSASSNVVPIDGVATGTAILPATDGAWCTLVSDGTNWIIMQRGS